MGKDVEKELRRAEEALARSEEKLRQALKLEAVGRLAGGVAHDFNNFLTVITGYSDMLLRRIQPHDPNRGFIEEIKRAGERAAELTRQLLAFSRKQILRAQAIDLNSAVQAIGQMLQPLLGDAIELVITPESDLHLVKLESGQVEQVLMNLVLNARDAMPGGGRLSIETRNVALAEGGVRGDGGLLAGSYVLLLVSDTGCGMTPEVRERIFEPFFTTKEKGTGLGLMTVQAIVRPSGGHIAVCSAPGAGTTFEVYLPATDEPRRDHASPAKFRRRPRRAAATQVD
jgi:two-component system, cell cycle sensor histidine kinase and response regulator CckA